MKKIISVLSLCFCFLFAGVMLSACGEDSNKTISITADSSLVSAVLSVGDNELSASESGKYSVAYHSNVRVEVYSAAFGVDFSNVELTINGENREFFKSATYSATADSTSQYAGYFLLAYISKDQAITISGLEKISTTFTISKADVDDEEEEIEAKLSHVYVNTSLTGGTFVKLSEFLASGSQSYTRSVDDDKDYQSEYRTLRIKFDNEYIFELSGNAIQVKNDSETTMQYASFIKADGDDNGEYLLYLGNIDYEENYYIVVDFSKIEYKEYAISLPDNTDTYTISVDSATRIYGKAVTITITATSGTDCSQMVVTLDGEELTQASRSGDVYTYTIEANSIPKDGASHNVTVSGVDFSAYVYSLSLTDQASASASMTIYSDATQESDVTSSREKDEKGVYSVLSTDSVAITWDITSYQFYIYANDELLFNLNGILSGGSETLTRTQGIYTLVATYDEDSYTSIKLTFSCSTNISITISSTLIGNEE